MDDFTPGFLYGLGAPPPAPTYNPQPIRNGPGAVSYTPLTRATKTDVATSEELHTQNTK